MARTETSSSAPAERPEVIAAQKLSARASLRRSCSSWRPADSLPTSWAPTIKEDVPGSGLSRSSHRDDAVSRSPHQERETPS